jgi:hypothetical protein
MSNLILYINNYPVDYGDVKSFPALNEEISYESSLNIPDSCQCTLDNSDPSKYDHKIPGSLLFGTKKIGVPVALYDPDIGQFVFRGVTKNITTTSGANQEIQIDITSQLSALSQNDCEISESGITPANAIYKLLTTPISRGSITPMIDPSFIDQNSFAFAHGVQSANRCTMNINISKDGNNNKKYSDVLPEISKIGHCFIYSHYDRIYLYQYTTKKNPAITISDPVAGSYKDYFKTDESLKMRNSYTVAYMSGSNVAFARGKNDISIKKYGESIFGVPTDEVGSDSSNDFNILIDNVAGAHWCGKTALERFSSPLLGCEFTLEYSYNFLKVGDIVGLDFDSFSETPVLILGITPDKSGNRIDFKCLFLDDV